MAKRVTTDELMEVLIDFRDAVAKKFEKIERKLLEHDRHFVDIERKLSEHDRRFDAIDRRFGRLETRIEEIEQKIA